MCEPGTIRRCARRRMHAELFVPIRESEYNLVPGVVMFERGIVKFWTRHSDVLKEAHVGKLLGVGGTLSSLYLFESHSKIWY